MKKREFDGYAVVPMYEENYGQKSNYLYFKKWEKNDKKRIYINDYKRRTIGYIEDGQVNITDIQGIPHDLIDGVIKAFTDQYNF